MLFVADIINSILQCSMFIILAELFTDHKIKNKKINIPLNIMCLTIIFIGTTWILGNSSLGAVIIHIVIIVSGMVIFRKDSLGATITFSMVYLCIISNVLFCTNVLFGPIVSKVPAEYSTWAMFILLYIPQYIMTIAIFKYKEKLYKVYLTIKSKKYTIISLVIVSVLADFILFYNAMLHELDNPIFKELIFILLCLFLIGLTIYFANIEKKSRDIISLNIALEEKLNELKKVKHDYGAQISYLYGLHLMGKHDRIGALLKDIINGHDSISLEIQLANNKDSIIVMTVNSINHEGINVIIDEQANLEELLISEMEIQRIISNILRNSITAINGTGRITIKTYYEFGNIVIAITNDGPKIPSENIDEIFSEGFSTKKYDEENNGFGLSIVKELVEKYNGCILVTSSEIETEFKLKIPVKE